MIKFLAVVGAFTCFAVGFYLFVIIGQSLTRRYINRQRRFFKYQMDQYKKENGGL